MPKSITRLMVTGALAAILSLSSACTNAQNANDANSATPATSAAAAATTNSRDGLYPVPVTPSKEGQGTFIRFETGWQRTSLVQSDVETTCTRRTTSDSSTYSAASSEFDRFDTGSDKPGEDFSVELVIYSDPDRTEASDATASLTMTYVSGDGVHRKLRAQDRLVATTAASAAPGAGFSAIADVSDPNGKTYSVAVTGFIQCGSVQEY